MTFRRFRRPLRNRGSSVIQQMSDFGNLVTQMSFAIGYDESLGDDAPLQQKA